MDRVKNIVYCGIYQGWSKENIISQITYKIASKEESEILFICGEIPELTKKAEELYEKYRKEYYKEYQNGEKLWL